MKTGQIVMVYQKPLTNEQIYSKNGICKKCLTVMDKLTLDPNADGDQWIYRDCLIIKQDHPELLKYACYTNNEKFIGVANTHSQCKILINSYLSN